MLACEARYQKNVQSENLPIRHLTTIGLSWEEDTVQRSMMLNHMPIAQTLHMKEVISTGREAPMIVGGTCSPVDQLYATAVCASDSTIRHG